MKVQRAVGAEHADLPAQPPVLVVLAPAGSPLQGAVEAAQVGVQRRGLLILHCTHGEGEVDLKGQRRLAGAHGEQVLVEIKGTRCRSRRLRRHVDGHEGAATDERERSALGGLDEEADAPELARGHAQASVRVGQQGGDLEGPQLCRGYLQGQQWGELLADGLARRRARDEVDGGAGHGHGSLYGRGRGSGLQAIEQAEERGQAPAGRKAAAEKTHTHIAAGHTAEHDTDSRLVRGHYVGHCIGRRKRQRQRH